MYMFESFILGMVQGIAEWLPISSEAMIILVKNNFFPSGMNFSEMISFAIFLHLGTLFAATLYFRKKIVQLIKNIFNYKKINNEDKNYLLFIIIATIISGILGLILLKIVEYYQSFFNHEFMINIFVASFLIITAVLLYISENKNNSIKIILTKKRAFLTGIFQGFAAIPGISRSGSTIAGMGLLGINKEQALELSFILSIPLVFLANVVLNYSLLQNLTINHVVALISAFVFGIITIELLLRLVRKIRFSYFVGFFAFLLILLNLFT